MGHRPETNAWMAFMVHIAPVIAEDASVFEIGPGNHKRSLIRKFCADRGHRYSWADLNNRGGGRPGRADIRGRF